MTSVKCQRYPARHYGITPDALDEYALIVIKKLQKAGFEAYIVGGGVRDLLVSLQPKDFDVATNATPEQVKQVIKNTRLIGKRFRLAHVFFRRHIIEVATFRSGHDQAISDKYAAHRDGLITRDNVYGTIEEDALRRDLTINALFYDPIRHEILDFVGGMKDMKKQQVQLIGDPAIRYREDPVRMLRVLRIANKLGFAIEKKTETAIIKMAQQLQGISSARLFEEYLKLFLHGRAAKNMSSLRDHRCFECLFPITETHFGNQHHDQLIQQALENTDQRICVGKTINPGFLIAVFLWHPMLTLAGKIQLRDQLPPSLALHAAVSELLQEQTRFVSMPRRFNQVVRDIWALQSTLERRRSRAIHRILEHSRFRAAYDFLLLRQVAGEVSKSVVDWWTKIQTCDYKAQQQMVKQLSGAS